MDSLQWIHNNSSQSLTHKLMICENLYNYYISNELNVPNDVKQLIIIELKDQIMNDIYNQAIKVHRSDIIGKYVGWTTRKTFLFLQNAKNKTIIIYDNFDDTFGLEAIMTIEHYYQQNSNIMIFKDKISI